MRPLGFEIIRTPYPPESGLAGEIVQKIRVDGRVGPAVGDEALLWDNLKACETQIIELQDEIAELRRQLESRGRKK